ncbi:PQQ-dependent sugar dehydrogenase [Galactobacter valiniphilus]|uniref:PQQ-dependent sugar dehydrogenase n=1 Tax=Galactobacter valiniphilus TaxID=2676122 RepID=UPI0037370FDC
MVVLGARRRGVRFGALAAVPLLLTACVAPLPPHGFGDPPAVRGSAPSGLEVVATDLEAPWSLTFAGRTPLISLRDAARIVELDPSGEARVVGTVPGVKHGGEGGLLGLAADGAGHLFVYSTGEDGNRIQRFELLGEPGSLRLGSARDLLTGIPAGTNHNGGRLALGPDGMLYAGTGDAGERESAQDLDSLAGKILRLRPDGSVPADNPFPGSPVYSYGHRNPQGLAFTPDGRLLASEFGQNTWDELNVIEAGKNYGWPTVEGRAGRAGLVDPVWQATPEESSPSGIAVANGTVFIAGLRGRSLLGVPIGEPPGAPWGGTSTVLEGYGRLRDAVRSPDGRLWVLSNNTDGRGQPGDGDDKVFAFRPNSR